MFGGNLMRPKWGIYRSIADKTALRDETVLFRNICIQRLTNKIIWYLNKIKYWIIIIIIIIIIITTIIFL